MTSPRTLSETLSSLQRRPPTAQSHHWPRFSCGVRTGQRIDLRNRAERVAGNAQRAGVARLGNDRGTRHAEP